MNNVKKRKKIIFVTLICLIAGIFLWVKFFRGAGDARRETVSREIKPVVGEIRDFIQANGTILPKNRLEVRPPISGRIDSILVREGETVEKGQTLAWMSSTERATLLDAARGATRSNEAIEYWSEIYKAIPIIAPIDGNVIVAKLQSGQMITQSDPVVVLSDQLIVRAQVDETDIGKIRLGQKAVITQDAYPEVVISAEVEHIYHESKTVSNVTVYEVDLRSDNLPAFSRSGMNTTINFVNRHKENSILLPINAVSYDKDGNYVWVKRLGRNGPERRPVELGITDSKNIEITSGISADDIVLVKGGGYSLPRSNAGANPFIPQRKDR